MEESPTKRIAKNTLVLYFRMIVLMIIGLYTSRVNLDALGISDYGIYNVVGGFVAMFSMISGSLTAACTRFLNYEMGKENSDRLNTVFCSSVNVQYILAFAIAVIAESIGIWYVNHIMVMPADRIHAANWVFQFSIFTFCFNLITVPYNAVIVAHEKMKTFAYISILEAFAKLGICFLIIYYSHDKLILFAFLNMLLGIIIRSIYQAYCKRNFDECKYHFVFDKEQISQMFSFAGWNLIGSSSAILKNQGVSIAINLFFGTTVNAARGVSNQVQKTVSSFASNFMTAVKPQITQSFSRGNLDYMFKLVNKGSRFSFYVLFIIGLPMIINADYLLNIWLKEVPPYSVVFTQFSIISTLIYSFSETLITAQLATGNIRNYQIIVGGIQMMDLPLVFLVLWLGAPASATYIIGLIVEVCCLCARVCMIPQSIPEFKPKWFLKGVVLNCIKVSVLSSIIPIVLSMFLPENFFSFCLNVLACVIISSCCIFYVGCKKSERESILKMVFNKLYR